MFSVKIGWRSVIKAVPAVGLTLLVAGCGGSGGVSGGGVSGGGGNQNQVPTQPNPVALEFRTEELGRPNRSDGRDWRSREYQENWGLDAISADKAYQRGYFGQGVTIAVADDGMDLTHPDLADKIRVPRHIIKGNAEVYEDYIGFGSGHGTMVAMIAAGARGASGEVFQIDVKGGNAIPTKNIHGVAPQAHIMPIALNGGAQPVDAMRYAADNRAQVINLSIGVTQQYWGKYNGRDGVWVTQGLPLFRPILSLDLGQRTFKMTQEFTEVAAALENADIVAVWAAGNDSWNSLNNRIHMCGKNHMDEDGCELGDLSFTAREFMENFQWLYDPDDPTRTISFRDMWGTDCGRDDCAEYNSPGDWKEAPLFEPGLLGKWLVVAAMDEGGEITGFSNGCGAARNWCLIAPGANLAILPDRDPINGTSFAAPMASGALATLKSRLPSMPMEVVQAVLLVSADPLGTRLSNPDEPDPVYGWGRLNLGNAITMQGQARLPFSMITDARSTPLQGAHVTLSPALAHAGEQMGTIQLAVGGIGSAYYNTTLSRLVNIETASLPALGYAARDMLPPVNGSYVEGHGLFAEIGRKADRVHAVGVDLEASALGQWRLHHDLCDDCERSAWQEWDTFQPGGQGIAVVTPFFARAGGAVALQMQGDGMRPFAAASGWNSEQAPWRQLGLQWRHARGGIDVAAEFSHIDEDHSVWRTSFGALGQTRTATRRSRLSLSAPLGGNWRGFANYEHNLADVAVDGGILSSITGLQAEGWSTGVQGRNVFRDDSVLRFSVRQETGVNDGQARFDNLVATGSSFVDAFYRKGSQSLERQQTEIDLRARPVMRYALGYALLLERTKELALGLEYEDESRKGAISTHFRMTF